MTPVHRHLQQVDRYARELELLARGDVVHAKNLQDSAFSEEKDDQMDDVSSVPSGRQQNKTWTSVQLKEAHYIFSNLLKKRVKKCANCGMKSPSIKCQIYGWLTIPVSSRAVSLSLL